MKFAVYRGRPQPVALPTAKHLARPRWLKGAADVTRELVLIDQGAAEANAIKRQDNGEH